MGRWPADSGKRLKAAALELFAERGFAAVTGADIARKAGLTERTFFRHFATKEDALFADDGETRAALTRQIAEAPDGLTTQALMRLAIQGFDERFPANRAEHERMATVVAREPTLALRMLRYEGDWAAAMAEGFRARGWPEDEARLVAALTASAFRLAYDRWTLEPDGAGLATRFDVAVTALMGRLTG